MMTQQTVNLLAVVDEVTRGAWGCLTRLSSEIGCEEPELTKASDFLIEMSRIRAETRNRIFAWVLQGEPDNEAKQEIDRIILALKNLKELFRLSWNQLSYELSKLEPIIP